VSLTKCLNSLGWHGFSSSTSQRLLWLMVLIVIMPILLFRADFFGRPFFTTHDTQSYADLRGIRAGFSLKNFSSRLRTPGYSLFLSLVTFGEIPNPQAVRYVMCGDSVFGGYADCAGVAPAASGKDDVLVRMPPVVYSYSPRIAELFQRATFVSRLLLIVSLFFLYWAMSYWVKPSLSLLSILFVWHYINLDYFFGIITESLYPTLPFLYVSCLMMYLSRYNGGWLVLASTICGYSFLVRPVFLYLPLLQVALLCFCICTRKTVLSASIGVLVATVPIIWVFFFSPVEFFSIAARQQQLLRAAIFSNQRTVDCVAGKDVKTVLSAFIKSAEKVSAIDQRVVNNDIDRYYLMGTSSIYWVNLPTHPIYQDETIKPYLNKVGLLPNDLVARMLQEAGSCNRWREIGFFVLTTKMVLGLTPVLNPDIRRQFFATSYSFYLSAFILAIALGMLIGRQKYELSLIIGLSAAIYLAMVFIVAATQGGEDRYTFVVEPLFVLSVALAFSSIIQHANWFPASFKLLRAK
jgi:hypothetical protein